MTATITSQKALRIAFWDQAPGAIKDVYHVTYSQNAYSATVRCMWVDFVDAAGAVAHTEWL